MAEEISYVGDAGGDSFLDVSFYTSVHEGQEVDFVRINVPGDKTFNIDTVANDGYKARFRRQWEAYKGVKDIKGTPLSEWPEITESLRLELAYQGFRFIEQVAGAPDSAFLRIMGGNQLRAKAQAFINRGKIDSEEMIKKQADQIALLQEQMALLMETKATAVKETPKPTTK